MTVTVPTYVKNPQAYETYKARNRARIRAMVRLGDENPAVYKRHKTNLKKAHPSWAPNKVNYESRSKLKMRHPLRFNQLFVEELKKEGLDF